MTAITGETGAGKTILTQAVGLLLGAKGDAGIVGAAGTEAYIDPMAIAVPATAAPSTRPAPTG